MTRYTRLTRAALTLAWLGLVTAFRFSTGSGRRGRLDALGRSWRTHLESLGGLYQKAGQLLATRRDLLPAPICEALQPLQDRARPMGRADLDASLSRAFGDRRQEIFESFDPVPAASATMAQVHRAVLRRNGAVVAVKLKRPGIDDQIAADVRLLRALVAILPRFGRLRFIPVKDAVDDVCESLLAQRDFLRECAFQLRCRAALARYRDVVVPRPIEDLCGPDALVMEFLPGLSRLDESGLDGASGLVAGLRALYDMLFRQGVAHCDLHAGNILRTADGRTAILDFGFTAEIGRAERLLLAEFFLSIAANDGLSAAHVVRSAAARVPPDLDEAAFVTDIGALVAGATARPAGGFSVVNFVTQLFAVQARHRVTGSRAFVSGIVALAAFEGLVRALAPDVDFQREAMPFVLDALETEEEDAPAGRPEAVPLDAPAEDVTSGWRP